jgi:hypothetical protein
MGAQRRVATFRLDEDLRDGLEAVWQREGIPPSEQVRRAIREWLKSKGIKTKAPATRMGAVRKGIKE